MRFRTTNDDGKKPRLLQAIEKIIAPPHAIRATVDRVRSRTRRRWAGPTEGIGFKRAVADDLIKHYSKKAALVGVATSAATAVPGLGNIVAVLGASVADLALCLKIQVELVAALGHLFGRDIDREEEGQLYLAMAGLGMATHAGVVAAEEFSIPAIKLILRRLLRRGGKKWLWRIFRLLAKALLGKGLRRFIPAGIGAAFSYTANRQVTRRIGRRARDFFLAELEDTGADAPDLDDPLEHGTEPPAKAPEPKPANPPKPEVEDKEAPETPEPEPARESEPEGTEDTPDDVSEADDEPGLITEKPEMLGIELEGSEED